jgi:signal transduction histidine kinase/CheY-like chemotaxis protein/CHASE3 domain sensor protein
MPLGRASIRTRICVGFAIVVALLGVQLWVALGALGRLRALRREIVETFDPPSIAAQELEHGVLYRAIALRNYVASGVREHGREYGRLMALHDETLGRIEAMPLDPESRAAFAALVPAYREHMLRGEGFLSAHDRRAPAVEIGAAEQRLSEAREDLLTRIRTFDGIQRRHQIDARARMATAEREVAAALLLATLLVAAALGLTATLTTRAVRGPALVLVRAAEAVGRGEYGPALALAPAREGCQRGELQQLAAAFARMADALRRREQRAAVEGRLAAALAGSLDPETTAASALDVVVAYTGADAAAIYVAEGGGGALRRIAGRAVDASADPLPRAGIVADALETGRAAALDVPADLAFAVHAGFGTAKPRSVLAVPLASRGERIGVLLLGSVRAMSADAAEFAEHAGGPIGIALQNSLSHVHMGALAEELRDRAALLQSQNEELQAQGEEIQAQSEELHAQGDEIRRQNEDLSAARDALAAKAAALEQVDRRKNEFLATLGHELRNPLAAVATAGSLLQAEARDGRMIRHASVVARQVRNLRRLVDDLLDLSRIDHGKIELRRERLDLRAAVEAAIQSIRAEVEMKALRVSFEVAAAGALAVDADPVRLEQVLSNLLRNAVKYTPPRGTITVAAEADGGSAVVRVGDTGVGISPDLLPRIFEPFIQGTHSEAGEQGLGLGLALVRRLVEMHGGTVEARSEGQGTGTVFVVRLPLAAPARQAPAAPPPAPAGEEEGRIRVLLVEDDPDVAMTTADALELCGFTVRVERDAEAGLRACLDQTPDVALLDIGLEGRSGHDLARDIRARLPRSAVRLVAVTGYGLPEDRARAEDAGFDLHLVKPVALDELRGAIERLAGERGAETAA